jgi:hypothetical protein
MELLIMEFFLLNAYLSGKIFYSGVCGAVAIFDWVLFKYFEPLKI